MASTPTSTRFPGPQLTDQTAGQESLVCLLPLCGTPGLTWSTCSFCEGVIGAIRTATKVDPVYPLLKDFQTDFAAHQALRRLSCIAWSRVVLNTAIPQPTELASSPVVVRGLPGGSQSTSEVTGSGPEAWCL